MIDIQGINILACPKQNAGSIDNTRSNNDHKELGSIFKYYLRFS
jgi:hypothetical protein